MTQKKYAKTPTVYQMEATECGAASLSMIMGYYGKHVALEQLRVETGVSRDGCNAKNIMKAGKKFGFIVKGYSKSLEGLLKLKPPCIIHWNFNHFVVWEGMKGKYAYINDPGMGRRKLTLEDIGDCFTGVVLTFEKTDKVERSAKSHTLFTFIRNRLKGQYVSLTALFAIGLCLVFPGMVIPVFSQVFIDEILIGKNTGWFTIFLVVMGCTVLFQAALTSYRGILLEKLQSKLALISAHKFLSHMLRLPMNFFDQRYAGDLAERVENNNSVSNFLAGDLAETVLNIAVAAFYLILLAIYSPLLTLIGLVSVIINIIVLKFSSEATSDSTMKLQQDMGKMVGTVYAGLSISSTLKASGVESVYVGRIQGHAAKTSLLEQKLGRMQQALDAIPEVADEITNVLVMLAGGVLVMKGSMTPGMLVAYTSLLDSFVKPVNDLVGFVRKIQTLKADMSRVEDILKYRPDEKFNEGTQELLDEKLSGAVEGKELTFGYSTLEPPLIKDFSFALNCGSSIAIVGPSGCGKSTVSKMISGLYRPWEGEVLFDDVRINQVPKAVIAASIATVSQDIHLFSGTIRDNLTMWNHGITDGDLVKAAKDACIHDTITTKPGAYDYMLVENGSNLSGGQRQRLEIARALVTNPSILVLDEATSALDPIVEKEILDNIKRRGCTCVIVAHRLSAIRDCDEILVMERGKIVQRGTHEELVQTDGHYRRLIQNT
jgi:NHLM bacteriocin system ABC transporter peptidase/ATP-binding protein